MDKTTAFQDTMIGNHCFGCGADNTEGLQIKSYWSDTDLAECTFVASPHHCSGPEKYLNGGIISTLIDCHCVCTAIAKAYQMENRAMGDGEPILFVTGNLDVSYRAPTPIEHPVILKARVLEAKEKKITLECSLLSGDILCAVGTVIAIRAPKQW